MEENMLRSLFCVVCPDAGLLDHWYGTVGYIQGELMKCNEKSFLPVYAFVKLCRKDTIDCLFSFENLSFCASKDD